MLAYIQSLAGDPTLSGGLSILAGIVGAAIFATLASRLL